MVFVEQRESESSFREGRKIVEDNEPVGCPQIFHTAENIEKVSVTVSENRQQTITEILESTGISESTSQRILNKGFNMHKVRQHIISRMLTDDQKAILMEMAGDLISALDKNRLLFNRIITGNEKVCFYMIRN